MTESHSIATTSPSEPVDSPQPGPSVVSWLLIFMALAAFAPCVILPEWRAYQALGLAEGTEQRRVDALQEVVDRDRRYLDALQTDPAVVARLARRELGFEEPGSRSVHVSVPIDDLPDVSVVSPPPVDPPPVLAAMRRYLPDLQYDRVFCDDESRTVIMLMSGGLMVIGICLPRRG